MSLRSIFKFIIILIFISKGFTQTERLYKFNNAKSWLYQLQNLNFNLVKDANFDILVTDYSWDGTELKEYRAGQIKRLKNLTKMVVLAYLSIGEAEDYRFYWKNDWKIGHPDFILEENPNWKGNYKVKYWDPDWQNIIKDYIDRIIDMGFDGLYLDIIDAYEYCKKYKENSKDLMIDFVLNISKYCREKRGIKDFIIVPQNAEELVENKKYLETISGIAREEVYFKAMDIPSEDTEEAEKYLDIVVKAGKKVLTVDYCTNIENIKYTYTRAIKKGYIPYCTVVDLDRLIINNFK